jgi:chloride channel protein, CIC family
MGQIVSVEPVNLEQPVVSIRRWSWKVVLASTLIGALGALAASLIRLGFRALQWSLTGSAADAPTAALHLPLWRRLLTPVLGALLAMAVLWLQRRLGRQQGREPEPYVEYVEAVRHGHGRIPLTPNSWRTLSAAFSVSSGAAVGREGSMIQFAAAVASLGGGWRGWLDGFDPALLSFLVACGVAGGVTTAYNSPIAAVFFAAEIVLGGLQWAELPLLGLASAAGWGVSGALLGRARLYPVKVQVDWSWHLLALLGVAALAGLAGPLYQWLLSAGRSLRRLPFALVWSGIIVGWLSQSDPRVWGNGDLGLRAAFGSGAPGDSYALPLVRIFLLRTVATLACVWTGTIGGVFTPTLFAGAAAGALLAFAMPGHNTTLWAIAGMTCLMSAVTHAPLMAACLAAELTGAWILLPLLLPLSFLSWLIASHLSPRAMYAIASQEPAHESAMRVPHPQTVE